MFKPFLKFGNKTLIVAFETLAVIAIIVGVVFGAFVWKVSQGPISLAFAKDYVESALSSEEDEITVRFDDIVLSWPELKGRFLLDLTNLKIQKGKTAGDSLSIAQASVGLSRRALMFGRIRPISVIISSPTIELVRTVDGKLNLTFSDKSQAPAPQEQPEAPDVRERGEEVAQIFKDMAGRKRGAILSRLDEFVVKDASLAVRDYQFGISWYLTDFDFELTEHPQGVAASLHVELPGGKMGNAAVNADLVYRKESDDFRAAARVEDINPYVLSRFLTVPDIFFTGDFDIDMDRNLTPIKVSFKGGIPEGAVNIPEEYDAPIALKNIVIASDYDARSKTLAVSTLSGEIGGIAFTGGGSGAFTDTTLSVPIQLNVASVALEQIPPLFPKSEHSGEAYTWLGRDIQAGSFSDVALTMELAGTKTRDEELQRDQWDIDVPNLKLDFAFEGAKVVYNSTLMPVENAKGKGTLDLGAEILEMTGESATIGDLTGTDIKLKVDDLMTAGAGYVYLTANVKGPMATALSYIAAEPIGMDKEEIGIDAKTVKGTIDAAVDISMPTIKDIPKEDVNVKINGTLTDIDIPAIVSGLPLSGGPLSLVTEPGGFRIKGNAKLAGRETVMEWHQYFESKGNPYSMKINAQIGADQELRNHFGVDLDEYISGTMPIDVTYTSMGNGTSQVDVKGDLNPVRIYIDPFKFEKPVGTPGTITASAFLQNDILKELKNVEIKSKDFTIGGGVIRFAPMNGKQADLAGGSAPTAVIGKTQMAFSFDVTPQNVMKIDAKGPVFDLQPFLQDSVVSATAAEAPPPKEPQQAMNISLTADRMLAKNDQVALNAKTYLEIDTDGDITQIEMDATVGQGPLFVRFKPEASGQRTFRLEAQDAGAVLNTFGVYQNIIGGTLLIYGSPKDGSPRGDLSGAMRMENFRVIKAPALARLLGLMSLTGVAQLLGNQGLTFSKLESGFEWRFRDAGNLLIIKDGKTSGSSVGLTFSGVIDRGKQTTDVAGTIIPMTEVNSILSAIPIVGDILGGPGGLIAATYSMKGPSSNPAITVNPLSVLAPGIIRRILFEGGYESKIPDDSVVPPVREKPAQDPAKPSVNR